MSGKAIRLSRGCGKYLREVFGYRDVRKIDRLTLGCIRENAAEGYEWDKEILRVRQLKLRTRR